MYCSVYGFLLLYWHIFVWYHFCIQLKPSWGHNLGKFKVKGRIRFRYVARTYIMSLSVLATIERHMFACLGGRVGEAERWVVNLTAVT